MKTPPKELGQRTKAELEELFGDMYAGWDQGLVITQERFGNGDTRFAERPMTPLELGARYVAAEIGANIFEIANRAAFAPIITFSQIQAHLGPVFDEMTTEIESLRAKLREAEESYEGALGSSENWKRQFFDMVRQRNDARAQVEKARTRFDEIAAMAVSVAGGERSVRMGNAAHAASLELTSTELRHE